MEEVAEALDGTQALVSVAHIRHAPVLIAACERAGVSRAVLFSSTWRFSKFRTPEVEAVIAGEEALEASDLDATLLRPTMVYGPGDDRNISRLREHLRRHRVFPIFGSGECLVQPVYVADAADAVVAALGRTGTVRKAYEIAGPEPIPYREMIDTLGRCVGRIVLKVYIPIPIALPLVAAYGWVADAPRVTPDQVRRMGEDRAFDISETIRDLGMAPRSFEEGVRDAMRVNGEPEG
jgi:nucleoside-diphosphate-sugar epimerase